VIGADRIGFLGSDHSLSLIDIRLGANLCVSAEIRGKWFIFIEQA
jgi:hypothetical protein